MLSMAAETEALNSASEAAIATEATVTPASAAARAYEQEEEEDEEEDGDDEEVWSSSDSEIGDALDWLDAKGGTTGGPNTSAAFSLPSRRPNAHGGLLSRPLQPISNRTQKISTHIRAAPLEVGVSSLYPIQKSRSQPQLNYKRIGSNSIIFLSNCRLCIMVFRACWSCLGTNIIYLVAGHCEMELKYYTNLRYMQSKMMPGEVELPEPVAFHGSLLCSMYFSGAMTKYKQF